MNKKISCPNCHAAYEVLPEVIGRPVTCAQCRTSFKATDDEAPTAVEKAGGAIWSGVKGVAGGVAGAAVSTAKKAASLMPPAGPAATPEIAVDPEIDLTDIPSSPPPRPAPKYREPFSISVASGSEYKMVSMPPNLLAKMNATVGEAARMAAECLQQVVSANAVDGWEFFRIDEFLTTAPQGCFGILLPFAPEKRSHYVITFRRDRR